jgi:paraquat-inducible protein B
MRAMTDEPKPLAGGEALPGVVPGVVIEEKRRFSLVWLIPIVAAVIGGFVAYQALSEQGPEITIAFKTAEGLEAEKTKIRYKDVEIGQVESIDLQENLSGVILTAELKKGSEKYLTDQTRFWVVRAQVTVGRVTGLGTLFSGAYIAVDPVQEGKATRAFVGLEKPPLVTLGRPGREFVLVAERRGSLDSGSPIYYRQIQVGQLVGYDLEEDGKKVRIRAFIDAPHHERVQKNTRFWNASGFDMKLDASGVTVDTESVASLLLGGVAFDTPASLEGAEPAEAGHIFPLYENRQATKEKIYTEKSFFRLYFSGSVRGLEIGAPVELRGIRIGEVTDIQLQFDATDSAVRIPVLIETEPERIAIVNDHGPPANDREDRDAEVRHLVAEGLRAQLKTGSLLTGALYIDFDFHPKAQPAEIRKEGDYLVLPTVPTPLEEISTSLTQILEKFQKIPIDQIGNDLRDTVQGAARIVNSAELSQSLEHLNEALKQLNTDAGPALTATLKEAERTFASAQGLLSQESPPRQEINKLLVQLSRAARSIRDLASYLQRHPEALIKGKGAGQ